jgi:hypothetical protein
MKTTGFATCIRSLTVCMALTYAGLGQTQVVDKPSTIYLNQA